MQKIKTKFAFTLLETLVVVIIIAVLATLAFKQYEASSVRAKSAEIVSTVTLLALGEEKYLSENGVYWNTGMSTPSLQSIDDNLGVTIPQNSEFKYYMMRFANNTGLPENETAAIYVFRSATNNGLCSYSLPGRVWTVWPTNPDEWAKYLKLPQ